MLPTCKIANKPIEIIKNKLYWVSSIAAPKNEPKSFFFNIDNDLVYEPFFSDFGPLDLAKTCKFALQVEKLLSCSQFTNSKIYHHTSLDDNKRANAAFLMCAFQILILNKTAEESWEPFERAQAQFIPFRDASMGSCSYKCSIMDCLKGLEYAIKLKWFNIRKFDIKEYEHYAKVENGDLNWIIPGKFLAFSGPSCSPRDKEGYKRLVCEDFLSTFKKLKVKMVIRLNCKEYEEEKFKKWGLKHKDFCFPDHSIPNDELVNNFISTCEAENGAIAVHCKTGLGRTGTMIACYIMKHYKFPARSLIGWLRLCRPGSVLGKQQNFLMEKEAQFQYHQLSLSCPLFGPKRTLNEGKIQRSEAYEEREKENLVEKVCARIVL